VVEATCQFSVYILVVSANAELIEAWIPITAARSAKFARFLKAFVILCTFIFAAYIMIDM